MTVTGTGTTGPKPSSSALQLLPYVIVGAVALLFGVLIGYGICNLQQPPQGDRNASGSVPILPGDTENTVIVGETGEEFGVMLIHLVADASYICNPRNPVEAIQETDWIERKLGEDDYITQIFDYIDAAEHENLIARAWYQSVETPAHDCHTKELELLVQQLTSTNKGMLAGSGR